MKNENEQKCLVDKHIVIHDIHYKQTNRSLFWDRKFMEPES